ncbi:MAG: type II restriction endonuclease [Alphaproteobacteria bacterium]|nr:type II restriction endonuclease [Alphaproteobacteria bacterium]
MAAIADLNDWLDEQSRTDIIWYIKRLSANDTLATGGHQAGPYIPKDFLFSVFPELKKPDAKNPDIRFELRIDSHSDARLVRAVWYNNKLRGGTRNETRLTGFGGSQSALLDPDSTGALVVFAFQTRKLINQPYICRAWVCDDAAGVEADFVEERVGVIEPGKWKIWNVVEHREGLFPETITHSSCWLPKENIPMSWLQRFPSAAEIIQKTIEMRADNEKPVDVRLMRRRECEFEIFRSVEEAIELPLVTEGFSSVDDFISRAQTILQRRKARSGRSLELHTRAIFIEENLKEGSDFSHQPESDPGKRPDFLFPSEASYKDASFPKEKLRMLAVKTTCKDRWRQVINEADRIPNKHLLTLQEGVSEGQFREMTGAGISLVVPAQLKSAYPGAIQNYLQTLESFIGDIRLLKIS